MDDLTIKKMQEVSSRVTPQYSREWLAKHEAEIKAEMKKINEAQETDTTIQYLINLGVENDTIQYLISMGLI